jgi:hypothetical protein
MPHLHRDWVCLDRSDDELLGVTVFAPRPDVDPTLESPPRCGSDGGTFERRTPVHVRRSVTSPKYAPPLRTVCDRMGRRWICAKAERRQYTCLPMRNEARPWPGRWAVPVARHIGGGIGWLGVPYALDVLRSILVASQCPPYPVPAVPSTRRTVAALSTMRRCGWHGVRHTSVGLVSAVIADDEAKVGPSRLYCGCTQSHSVTGRTSSACTAIATLRASGREGNAMEVRAL